MKANLATKDGRIDTKGAAKFIGCSESLLTKMRVLGKGPRYLKIGGRVQYRTSDLDEWIAGSAVETADSRKAA